MTSTLVVIAHGGPGSTWQAMVVVAGVLLAGIVLAAGTGRLPIEEPGDLVTPLAATAIASSLGVLGHTVISDGIGWGLPLAVIALATLLLGAITPLDLRLPAPLPMGAIALTIVSVWALYVPLTIALHPPVELLPLSDDAALRIVEPADGDTLPPGSTTVTVAVDDGSIGPGGVPLDLLPDDPEEAGQLVVAVQDVVDGVPTGPQRRVDIEVDCTVTAPCREVTVELDLAEGTQRLIAELQRGDGTPLAPPVRATSSVEVTADP